MQVKFSISASLKADGGVENVRTPMLMLTKIQGMGLGAGPRAIDQLSAGLLTQRIEEEQFTGGLAQAVTVRLGRDFPQQNLVMMGLGNVELFNPCGLAEVIEVAIDKTLEAGCRKLTIPVVANRLTALNINLLGTAHIVRQSAERKLSPVELNDTFEIEFVCTPQARRYIKQGLDVECKHRQQRCCKGDND